MREENKLKLRKGLIKTLKRLIGTFAIVLISSELDGFIAARRCSPLVIGVGEKEYFAASDVPAFFKNTIITIIIPIMILTICTIWIFI